MLYAYPAGGTGIRYSRVSSSIFPACLGLCTCPPDRGHSGPGKRTVTSALRVMGLSDENHFQNYHRALNRAVWSCRHAGLILLRMLLATFVPSGPLVLGLDDTIERRWGAKIRARGIYRDPVRSSDSHFVKTSGLRWLSLMLLADVPWAGRVWALPFLTVLAPSERYWGKQKRKPKLLTDWARQVVLQVQRWFPSRSLVVVADGAFASLQLLSDWAARRRPVVCVTRLRLDARLFRPAPPRKKVPWVGRDCSEPDCLLCIRSLPTVARNGSG
jgi:hypothetical protein